MLFTQLVEIEVVPVSLLKNRSLQPRVAGVDDDARFLAPVFGIVVCKISDEE
ncbi:hypothetical protein [Pseudomonas glycinae]|uniref:hypothetical protein n=1 Tax=Pseudomonas glycinae TaxID=1785145 RepID=UPI00167C88EE|nr:hypothetical protein [Pseudomonas glycinae]